MVEIVDEITVRWGTGPDDWVQLPVTIMSHCVSDLGVTFHCVNGTVYHMSGNPRNPNSVFVRAVWRA